MKKPEPITKKYTFSTDERDTLQNVELGLISFEQAVMGMQMNKRMILERAYRRCAIGEKDGFTRSITYNLGTSEIIVTYTPKNEIEAKSK